MAKKSRSASRGKTAKKTSARKKLVRRRKMFRTSQSRTVSFFVGIMTVLTFAIALFLFAQSNNYKALLGERTQNQITK